MYIYIYMYGCLYVCIYVECVCLYVCMYVCMYMYVCLYVFAYVYIYINVYVCPVGGRLGLSEAMNPAHHLRLELRVQKVLDGRHVWHRTPQRILQQPACAPGDGDQGQEAAAATKYVALIDEPGPHIAIWFRPSAPVRGT